MIKLDLKELKPNITKNIYKKFATIASQTNEFKTIAGKLMLLHDGDISEDILMQDPNRAIFVETYAKQIAHELEDNKQFIASIQERQYLERDVNLHHLSQIEKYLKLEYRGRDEYSKIKMKLHEA